MFRDDRQACQAPQELLRTVSLEYLWTDAGPTPAALEFRDANGGRLSSGERVMLLAAMGLGNGSGNLPFHQLHGAMDTEKEIKLLSLVSAVASGAKPLTNGYPRDKGM